MMSQALFVAAALALSSWPPPVTMPRADEAGRPAVSQGPLVPQPFPGRTPPPRPTEPPTTAPSAAPDAAPATQARPTSSAPEGLPVYPTAEFIDAFDAGQGQRYYLFGSDMPYDDIVAYYRALLKNGGREVFREPPTRQFELGRYNDNTMAYPPSVVVKDYGWAGAPGFLAVSGTTERRYRTVIQIVPVTEAQ